MPNKFLALLFAAFFVANVKVVKASIIEIDSNIIILSATNTVSFNKDKQTGKVIINERSQVKYKNNQATILPITEFYDDHSKIVSISCKLNNKTVKDFEPTDTYYSNKGIFHSDQRIKYYPLQVPANSIIEVNIEKNTFDPIYFNTIYFSESYPVTSKEIITKIPRWMNVFMKEINFKGYQISKSNAYNEKEEYDITTYKCLNVPAVMTEDYSPGQSYIYPHLLALANEDNKVASSIYFKSTQEQYNWYVNLISQLNKDIDPVISAQAKEIVKDKTNDIDKIKAVYYWVQENVRYIAFEDGIAGFKPDSAPEVLRKKYGDCKGMANLTKTLLKSLGYDARLCWLGTNHIVYDYLTPSLAVDNHMICAVMINNKTYFLDTTETFLGFGEYAERIQGRQVLIENGDHYMLSNVPATTNDMNADVVKKKLIIQDKNLSGKVTHSWKGEYKEYLLSSLYANKKEDLGNNFNHILSNNNSNYEIKELSNSPFNMYDADITATYNLLFKNSVDVFDKSFYLSLDNDKEYENFVIDTVTRTHDLWLPFKVNIIKEIELTVPSNYVVSSKPENLSIKNENYFFAISYDVVDDKIIYKKAIKIFNTKIPKTVFSTWNADIRKLTQNYSETITLKPKL
ncbi:transglutaminase domain-containing protein [Pedobacter frigidisoli]|uniref:Transglutaminase domain-containing protein n=1 Tax=Pedobacter frigidisoli TaxID=2530455 RepID=A0A4R0NJ80_9SPHI|nr:transglutaminase-like domain-containing protein [Pedobacter frigidisoli]TCD00742.1 transglutaminase domain-containing protein [Pedobacter frigidisoli]